MHSTALASLGSVHDTHAQTFYLMRRALSGGLMLTAESPGLVDTTERDEHPPQLLDQQ